MFSKFRKIKIWRNVRSTNETEDTTILILIIFLFPLLAIAMTEYHSLKELEPIPEANWIIKVQVARKWKDFNYTFHRECGLNIIIVDENVRSIPLFAYCIYLIVQAIFTFSEINISFVQIHRRIVCIVGSILILWLPSTKNFS